MNAVEYRGITANNRVTSAAMPYRCCAPSFIEKIGRKINRIYAQSPPLKLFINLFPKPETQQDEINEDHKPRDHSPIPDSRHPPASTIHHEI